mmetsp:Transcript_15409/g.23236  ORF Transcript_15409/g.23236 Transcript_15409/m.23236 type:complete len:803 (-) Transcript_15409:116-2524(-)
MARYRIVSSTPAHDGPVKCVHGDGGIIISGGQDSFVRFWNFQFDSICNLHMQSAMSHNHWITAVSYLPPNVIKSYPCGAVVTGCMDNMVRLYDSEGNVVSILSGHTKAAISFSWAPEYKLVSGSWDGTARIWDVESGSCIGTFDGHENGVHVCCIDTTLIAVSTGEQIDQKPANFKIRLWSLETRELIVSPIEDHSGPIRSVFQLPGIGFGTTSNDGTVALRTLPDGTCVGVCAHPPGSEGFPPFVLDGTAVKIDDAVGCVSCGEDGSVVVWKGTELFQSIPHPSCVWAVTTVVNGQGSSDIVTACHDGYIRVFSIEKSTETSHALQLRDDFSREVDEAMLSKKSGPSQEEIERSPRWEYREQVAGTSEGQVRIFNKNSVAIAAQWNTNANTWIEIGEVTGSAASSDGGELNGIKYDHIIPVEIETPNGLITLSLGYNDTENHFTAAQRFIDEHHLEQGYLRQIADFISSRSGQTAKPIFDMSPSEETGLGNTPTPNDTIKEFVYIPTKAPMAFTDIPGNVIDRVLSKLLEFNSFYTSHAQKTLTESDISGLRDVLTTLGDTSHYHSTNIRAASLAGIERMACQWDNDNTLFPCFDILRMLVLHPSGVQALVSLHSMESVIDRAVSVITREIRENNQGDDSVLTSATALTSMRFLCNVFRHMPLRQRFSELICLSNGDVSKRWINGVDSQSHSPKKSHRLASMTFCHNFFESISPQATVNSELLTSFFLVTLSSLSRENESMDIVFRGLLAVGTAIYRFPNIVTCGDNCRFAISRLRELWETRLNDSVKSCLFEVESLLART